jgi:hypothetical protein
VRAYRQTRGGRHRGWGASGGFGFCPALKLFDEIARRLSHRHQNGHRLKGDRREQGDRHQKVKEEQDLPERVFSYYVEYYVHGISSTSSSRSGDDTRLGAIEAVGVSGAGGDKDEACRKRLSRSKIAREVLENLFTIFLVDSHTVADHLFDGSVPTLARQSGRSDDHAQVVTGLARAGHDVLIGSGR